MSRQEPYSVRRVIGMCARQHTAAEVACYRPQEDTDGGTSDTPLRRKVGAPLQCSRFNAKRSGRDINESLASHDANIRLEHRDIAVNCKVDVCGDQVDCSFKLCNIALLKLIFQLNRECYQCVAVVIEMTSQIHTGNCLHQHALELQQQTRSCFQKTLFFSFIRKRFGFAFVRDIGDSSI